MTLNELIEIIEKLRKTKISRKGAQEKLNTAVSVLDLVVGDLCDFSGEIQDEVGDCPAGTDWASHPGYQNRND